MFDQIAVTIAGAAAILALAWYFFGPKKAQAAELREGRQEVQITVKGGYSPDLIQLKAGVPTRLVFDRQETGECTSRVVLSDFRINRALPPYQKTVVEFTPDKAGEFTFACGMNMVHGSLMVEEGDGGVAVASPQRPEPALTLVQSEPRAQVPEADEDSEAKA